QAYNTDLVHERHRHRYEFNLAYRPQFEQAGFRFSGIYDGRDLVEIVEVANHPWHLSCQFHPEFKSKPMKPHPLFLSFIQAARQRARHCEKP
ncbi:MAG: CTP synthase, partial [Verrucomicrobiia bacterium]